MDKDFKIGQSNELVQGDQVFDLHNVYDFSGVTIGPDRTLQVSFQPNREHGKGHLPVLLEFREVDYLLLSPGFGIRCVRDLDEMGYMGPEQDDDQWLLSEDQATEADHLLIRLGSDYVRIHAQHAYLRISPSSAVASRLERDLS